jgi:hypothetical protein
VVPSYDAMGGCSEETEGFTLHIIQAVAAAFPDVPPAAIARRVRAAISCALIRSIAVNALDYRNGKLRSPSRSVGGLSPSSVSQESGGSSRSGKRKARGQQGSQEGSQELAAPPRSSSKRARAVLGAAVCMGLGGAADLEGQPDEEMVELGGPGSVPEGAGEALGVHLAVGPGPEVTGEVLQPGGGGSQGDAGASGLIFPDDDMCGAPSAPHARAGQ